MLCSSKAYYLFIILSISFSKVASHIDDATSVNLEENTFAKGESSEYFVTVNADSTTEKEEDNSPDCEDSEYSSKTPISEINEKIKVLKEKCPHYKHGKEVDLDKISDVWQVAYFHLKEDIPCFKIYIKKTTEEEKKEYMEKYGTFSNSVNWKACDLEIKGNEKSETQRSHFLQRGKKGIMDNIIIVEKNVPWQQQTKQKKQQDGYNSTYVLHPENPDQWLVVKNLLLMRDCNDGDVVVFSRVPHLPRRKDIMDALASFGEYAMEGKMGCK